MLPVKEASPSSQRVNSDTEEEGESNNGMWLVEKSTRTCTQSSVTRHEGGLRAHVGGRQNAG